MSLLRPVLAGKYYKRRCLRRVIQIPEFELENDCIRFEEEVIPHEGSEYMSITPSFVEIEYNLWCCELQDIEVATQFSCEIARYMGFEMTTVWEVNKAHILSLKMCNPSCASRLGGKSVAL